MAQRALYSPALLFMQALGQLSVLSKAPGLELGSGAAQGAVWASCVFFCSLCKHWRVRTFAWRQLWSGGAVSWSSGSGW